MYMQSKKRFYTGIVLLFLILLGALPVLAAGTPARVVVNDPKETKQLLVEGNKRFVSGKMLNAVVTDAQRKDLFKKGQTPFAAIVSCSDSRVPPELIFDQGAGDLFVVRVAGNVLDSVGMGSIEFGTAVLGTRIILVMGHEDCGAVHATVDGAEVSDNITSIAHLIQPAAKKVRAAKGPSVANKDLYEAVTDANVEQVVAQLKNNKILKKLVAEKKIMIIGGKYILATGEVKIFD